MKIIDYGLAWCRGEAKDRIQGTPEYIAPETARGRVVNGKDQDFQLRGHFLSYGHAQAPAFGHGNDRKCSDDRENMEFSSQTGIGVQFHHSSVLGGSS